MKICAVVPSLNPDDKLIEVVNGLKNKGFAHIIVVNDGSKESTYFDRLSSECVVLTHEVNKGKGRAMKTAMEYYLEHFADECDGVVFCDADNQHSPDDIVKCSEALKDNPDELILGVRDFSGDNVPKRSRMGNRTMAFLFKVIGGLNISDTQTGLRAMGNGAVKLFIKTKGERFEYETNMLLETKRLGVEISEVKIETIYHGEEQTSHFSTFRDSVRIFKVLLKFAWVSILSCLLDVGIFWGITYLMAAFPEQVRLLTATVIARICSSIFNYVLNHKAVFKSVNRVGNTVFKYYLLCTVQMLAAYFGVYLLVHFLHGNEVIMKLIVDALLFLLSFQIQRDWIFNKKRDKT